MKGNNTTLFLLFSHELTKAQGTEARERFGCAEINAMPEELREAWRNIPPGREEARDLALPFIEWLAGASVPGDYCLVQGDFGVTFHVVAWCLDNRRIPIYATTERHYTWKEKDDGSVENIHRFEHIMFRRYSID